MQEEKPSFFDYVKTGFLTLRNSFNSILISGVMKIIQFCEEKKKKGLEMREEGLHILRDLKNKKV